MRLRKLAGLGAALVVVGCGGSSKSTPPPAGRSVTYSGPTGTAPIDSAAGAQAAAASSYGAAMSLSSQLGSFSGLAGASVSVPRFTVQDALRLAAKYRGQIAAAAVSGVTVQATDDCLVSGTVTFSGAEYDEDSTTTDVGDYAQITFASCKDDDALTVDGSIRFEITETSDRADFLNGVVNVGETYAVELTFGNLAFVDANGGWFGMSGNIVESLSVSSTQIEASISGTSLVSAAGNGNTVLGGFQISAPTGQAGYSQTYVEEYVDGLTSPMTGEQSALDAKLCSTEMDGCVEITTSPAWRTIVGGTYPEAGAMTVTAGKARIVVEDQAADAVRVTYDLDTTDGTAATVVDTTWDCLQSEACSDF